MSEFKRWLRAKVITPAGEVKVRFDEPSTNTLSMEKYEAPFIIPEIAEASRTARIYISRNSEAWARNPDAATQRLTLVLREEHPALDGRNGNYILSDSAFKDLIDRALDGKKAGAASIYDAENERAARAGGHELTQETSKTYRKNSKPITRQKKQAKPGRPRKNPS